MSRFLRRLGGEDRGAAYSVVEMGGVLAFMILPTVMALCQLPMWIDAYSTADLAAQEAARAVAVADDWGSGVAEGTAVAQQLAVNHGYTSGEFGGVSFSGALERGGTITATATVSVEGILVPGVGYVGGPFSVTLSSSERVDDYRSFP